MSVIKVSSARWPVLSGPRVHDRIDELVSCSFLGDAGGLEPNMSGPKTVRYRHRFFVNKV